jgi:DNA polymerase III delta subunit
MKLKAVDFLAKSYPDIAKMVIILLDGEDLLLKEIISEVYGKATGLYPGSVEKKEISDARILAAEWGEGSLMGAYLLKVTVPGKMKHPEALPQIVKNKDTENRLLINSLDEWTGVTQLKIIDELIYIDCKEPSGPKERQKLISVRCPYHGLKLDEECLKAVAERCETVVEIEMALTTLRLLYSSDDKIYLKDVHTVTDDPIKFKDITKSVLRGNTFRLTKDLLEGDPLPTIGLLNSVLLKLYTFLNLPESKEDEEEAAEKMKIQKRHLKEWHQARRRFSPQLIRRIMGEVNDVYQSFLKGQQSDWKEKLRMTISRLNQK